MKALSALLVVVLVLVSVPWVSAGDVELYCAIESIEVVGRDMLYVTATNGEFVFKLDTEMPVTEMGLDLEVTPIPDIDEIRAIQDIGEGEWLVLTVDGRVSWFVDGQWQVLMDEPVWEYVPDAYGDELMVGGMQMEAGHPETLKLKIMWEDAEVPGWYWDAVYFGGEMIEDVPLNGWRFQDNAVMVITIRERLGRSAEGLRLSFDYLWARTHAIVPGTFDGYWLPDPRWLLVTGENFLDPDPIITIVDSQQGTMVNLLALTCGEDSMRNSFAVDLRMLDWEQYLNPEPEPDVAPEVEPAPEQGSVVL